MRLLRRILLPCMLLVALPAFSQAPPVLVGAALPQSGILADLAGGMGKALLLWQEEVNAGGGLDGRPVELKLLDDRSQPFETVRLYEQLILEHKVDLLIGPFGSAATLGAAAAANRKHRVMANATGAARIVHKSGSRYVFQVPAPLGSYGEGALELARRQGLQRLFLLARDDPGSREIATRAREEARKRGFQVGEVVFFAQGAEDFAAQVAQARAAGAEAWIAFGLAPDAAGMTKTFSRLRYAPRLFVAQGAAQPDFIARVGQAAEFVVGITPYDRHADTRGNAEFVRAYAKKWSIEPGPVAAEAYAAAKLLEEAVRRAGSLDQEKLRSTLSALETETPIGAYRVDDSGAQLAARPLLVQIRRGRPAIVWPAAYATEELQPYPAWETRQLLK